MGCNAALGILVALCPCGTCHWFLPRNSHNAFQQTPPCSHSSSVKPPLLGAPAEPLLSPC